MLSDAWMESTFALNVLHFYNYKQFFPVVLQCVSHSESSFIFIDIGAYGKQIDGDTYSASA
jgi:hypothetical protein